MEKKILYLWDLTGTLFHEKWNKEFTGVDSYEDWLEEKLNKNIKDVSPREYEEMCREPYSKGKHFNLDIYPGFKEVLEWTKNNEAFTSGLIEHNDWRAKYLNPILGYDIRQYFQKINTTFDYEDTNIKNEELSLNCKINIAINSEDDTICFNLENEDKNICFKIFRKRFFSA